MMIIYDILLILQYQVSSTVMDLIVLFCIVSFCIYAREHSGAAVARFMKTALGPASMCIASVFTGPFAVHDIRLPVRPSVRPSVTRRCCVEMHEPTGSFVAPTIILI